MAKPGETNVQDEMAKLRAMLAEAQAAKAKAEAEAAEAKAKAEAAKKAGQRAMSLKVSEKGAISVYGNGRFPTTLYAEQWERLLTFVGAEAGNPIAKFIADNAGRISRK